MNQNRWKQEAANFTNDCQHAAELSREILRKLMRDNQNTEYGRNHHFEEVKTVEDYQRLVPVTEYSDYTDAVDRMRAGEDNILTAYPLKYFLLTSGSTGVQKRIPLTEEALSRALDPVWYACHGNTPGIDQGKHLVLSVFRTDLEQPEPETLLSIAFHRQLHERGGHELERWVLGGEDLLFSKEIGNIPYVKLWILFSSPQTVGIQSVFLYDALLFFCFFEEYWREVLQDVERHQVSELIPLGPKVREALLALPRPGSEWLLHIRRECEAGFAGIMKRIWPDFQWLSGIGGSTFSAQEPVLRSYLGEGVQLHYFMYTASECFMGIALGPETREYVLLPRGGYFEFIPWNPSDQDTRIRTMEELEPGQEYEILVTNFSGLYRYQLGDVIRVTGFYGQAPMFEVGFRKNQAVNVAGEKTDMKIVTMAMERLAARMDIRIFEYSICDDKSQLPGKCLCFLEAEGEDERFQELDAVLDEILWELNDDYRDLRELRMILPPEVCRVHHGTHRECREKFSKKQSHSKPIHYLTDPKVIAFMKEKRYYNKDIYHQSEGEPAG
ncbi:MAG: GH3 auxin-responsive promoter family protein [Lachnospiraceae bacterium]|nr:GH3 auxin-responsive promoter family protein [Lachnospiraceae bacterium]